MIRLFAILTLAVYATSLQAQTRNHILFDKLLSKTKTSSLGIDLKRKTSQPYECLIVSGSPELRLIGEHSLIFDTYFDYELLEIRLNSGQVIEAFFDNQRKSVRIPQTPNFPDLNSGTEIHFSRSEDRIFLEWSIPSESFLRSEKDQIGRVAFHMAETLLEKSQYKSDRSIIYLSECRLKQN